MSIDEESIFKKLPNYQKDYNIFAKQMQLKLGIMFLFDDTKAEDFSFLNIFVEKISKIDFINDILRENCIITSLGLSSNHGKAVINLLIHK
jgi:hypothetical protein